MNVPSSTFLLCSQLSLKALTIFRRCTGSSEPSLLAYAIGTIISWTGLFHGNAINQDLESWYNQIILGLCVCAYTISVIMNSQDLPYVVSWWQQDTPRSAKQFVKMFHLFEPIVKAVITTFIELFTLRKPKLIFNYIKQNVRRYLEFDLVWACWVFIHFKLYVSEQRDPDEIAQTHMLSWALS